MKGVNKINIDVCLTTPDKLMKDARLLRRWLYVRWYEIKYAGRKELVLPLRILKQDAKGDKIAFMLRRQKPFA